MYYYIYIIIIILLPCAFLKKGTVCVNNVNGRYVASYKWGKILSLAFFLTIFLRGITYDTGADWITYYDYLHELSKGNETSWSIHTEWGYKMLCKILVTLHLPIFVFFCICTALNYYSFIKFSKLFYYCMPLALFMWYPFMSSLSGNIYRQFLAMAFFLISCFYILNKNNKLFLLYICTAVLFHTATIIIIPFLFSIWYMNKQQININKKVIMILVITSHIYGNFAFQLIAIFSDTLSYIFAIGNKNVYTFTENFFIENQYGTSYTLIFLPIHLYWIILADKLKNKFLNFRFLYYFSCIFFILYPISQGEFLMRMCLYFELFIPFLLTTIYFYYKKNSRITLLCYMTSLIPNWILFFHNFFRESPEQYITMFDKNLWY